MDQVKPQFLYIVGPRREGLLKIGVTNKPTKRLGSLQTGHPETLEIFWVYPCPSGAAIEPVIHRLLGRYRTSGEWFDVPVEIAMGALWAAASGENEEEARGWCRHIGLCIDCERPHTASAIDALGTEAGSALSTGYAG